MNHEYIEAHDLSAQYLAGRLTDDEEQAFEAHLVDCPQCIEAVECEMSLRDGLRLVASESAPAMGTPKIRPVSKVAPVLSWFQIAAAVLLAVSIGLGAWLSRSRAELRSARAERDELQHRAEQAEQSATALERRLAAVPARASDAPTPAGSPVAGVSPAIVSLFLSVQSVRGPDTGPAQTLVIPPGTTQVRVQLALDQVDYPSYRVALKPIVGPEVFTRQHLRPQTTTSGPSLVVTVPADRLAAGDYLLDLSGESPSLEIDDISKSLFRVERK